ncbi:hypothetical protein PNEG_00543 [Pneumocystis murina B123]|uniref:Uncharacterized protein n=1 Tax=Pneumocystis murina (strain B123) TaxID=1069680 RepID=M7NS01_PNEMU|nr:hypothetical protein PNEG_00543 [Pneumocystis murina B123]EMR11533.1 hypothetical protein PNEG_00543 [Pneumocystis murina B123]
MYNGLTTNILRQETYSTVHFGIYYELKSTVSERIWKSLTFSTLICIATISEAIGGVISNPMDIINIRMQNDNSSLYKEEIKRTYSMDYI